MKILTDRQISSLKNEVIFKMYEALVELHEKKEVEYHPGEETVKCHDHEEILDLVLKHFYRSPTGERKYDFSKSSDLTNFIV